MKKHQRQPKETIYPHNTSATKAPIEWEVFHIDIFVAN